MSNLDLKPHRQQAESTKTITRSTITFAPKQETAPRHDRNSKTYSTSHVGDIQSPSNNYNVEFRFPSTAENGDAEFPPICKENIIPSPFLTETKERHV